MLVVDASVWVAAFDTDDPAQPAAADLLLRSDRLLTLDLALYEVASVGSRWSDADRAAALLRAVDSTADLIRVDVALADRARALAGGSALSAYDAAYVLAARERGCPLVSLDRRDLVNPGHAVLPQDA